MPDKSFSIPRHWWGKIIGGVLGLFRGGISGALIGALLGHVVDRFLAGIVGVGSTQKSFFDALFATLGHLSKADGAVTQHEIRMVESLMQRMQIAGEDRQRAIRLFNQGKQPDFNLEKTLHAFAQHSMVRQDLRQMFMEILVETAFSSGTITQAEHDVLFRVARLLRIPGPVFSAMLNARGAGGARYGDPGAGRRRSAGKQVGTLAQAYAQLGLESKVSDAEVKKAYRKLVSQYHPDKLISRGLPEEMMELAKTRVREINTAYDQIKQSRGFK
ncbi:MAG: co-chaperone DjlA [Xanthomonadales bacterium]|nr:co-chaperone DjlA [Gammaproteobacteria bacterium]MBT8054086.1 co-chaperone DjlA [Gammaproteobacteria bacterium]NND55724.1 co-chaperone DjlA [Xanthomonadales bacterium]NNK51409.1 co-chaperone DjlA [Xanthomonadales bacterium]